jgi:hypothetical protein
MTEAIPVREFMQYTPMQIMSGVKTNKNVLFEDNVVLPLSSREIIINRYAWRVLELVPELAITSNFSVTNYFTNGIYTSKTINKCFEVMLEAIVDAFIRPVNDRSFLPHVYERMYKVFNEIYNELIYDNVNYAVSINIMDFLEIQFDPELIASMQDVYKLKTLDTVNKTYEVLERIIYNKPELKNNIIAKGYISGTFNANQIKQMLASRGYVTEIDSSIFKWPIASSFTLGLSDIYDITIESRSGAKALFLSNRAVQESEYSAREMQLVTMMVEKLVDGDCGNKDYLMWFVRGPEITGKSDIDNLAGKRYLNEETGKEEVITKRHKFLEGKTIKLRTAMNCKLTDKRHICTSCFGDLSYGIHDFTSIGHICSTTLTQQITQNILSTKHITSNATTGDIVLDKTAQEFFNIKNKNGYSFKPGLIGKKGVSYKLIITQYEAYGIKDLNPTIDVYKLNPTRVTRIENIILVTSENGKELFHPIVVKDTNKYGALTYEFLEYVLKTGYVLDDFDRYVIDLDGWKTTIPFITLPQVEFNFLAMSKNVKKLFKNMKIYKGDHSSETPESLLQILFDLVNMKLNVNIAMLEVVIYAFSIMSIKDKNYDIGRNSEDTQLMKIEGILSNRSLGGSYGWERVIYTILSPGSFCGRNAVDHPLDVLICPNETILDYYGTIVN